MDQFNEPSRQARRTGPGDALTCWEMSQSEETHFPGMSRPMEDRITYCFINGWVDTGDLPCRQALHELLGKRHVFPPAGPFTEIHWGTDGDEVDYSVFRYRPTLVRRGFRCHVSPEVSGPVTFRVATCGGVNIWLNGNHVAAFEPFQRNRPSSEEVTFDIPAGENELLLLLEDLHERDTTCFFSLTHVAGPALDVSIQGDADPRRLADVARILGLLRTDAVFATDGSVRLVSDLALTEPLQLEVRGPTQFLRGGLNQDPDKPAPSVRITLSPDAPAAAIFAVSEAPAGCLSLEITARVGGARLTRRLGITNVPRPAALSGDLDGRKRQAAMLIASAQGFEPSVAALLASRGEADALVAQIVEASLKTIEERHDCSDFTILPLLRLWRDSAGTLSETLRQRLKSAILGYRYWLDVPGDDVMWFWSENHVLCFHSAQFVAGALFPDETFTAHASTGREMNADAARRLVRWFDAIDDDGLCEWNSAAYYPIDFLGLFTLHDMAPAFRQRARDVLDRIFIMAGLHTTGGVPAGSQGRAYEKELLAGPMTELGSVMAIAIGGTFWTGYDRAAALFCLSDYMPPAEAARLARPEPGSTLSARYTQGAGHGGKLTLWKSAEAQLSTVTDLRTGERGHQAHTIDVQFAAHPMARLWINHPGELKPWGERRPSLLAGNHVMPAVAQHGSTALMVFDIERDWTDLAMTQVFAAPEAFDSIETIGDWLVFRAGQGRAAVWCSAPLAPVAGLYKGALRRAHGLRTGWIVTLARPGEDEAEFQARLALMSPAFDPEALELQCRHDKDHLSLSLTGGLRVGDMPHPFSPLSTTPHIAINDAPLTAWSPDAA